MPRGKAVGAKTPAKAPRKAAGAKKAQKAAPQRSRPIPSSADNGGGDIRGTLSQRREAAMRQAILEGRAAGRTDDEIRKDVVAAANNIKD